ncbi:hypothetical protein [Shimwellia blattae]|uniref:Lipoprotein n=1 Tax=Shimwellia blattae (strain ATCC 29907 / DSM 4481 / JCM 1650 / NBRC 105725 / CDC 9005-74) TaxID=630626 RepID=I2BDR3_SHIBC|nr:hypothetical protein [Shimwellia blattae]AFJ48667.1 hypothetical protein EBL_c36150 [Shimwellia blattae DSM 4481 = NBRC 105725]GAB81298.1 hypothetical protein EB105725_13_00340 [Shimwellia blattae DSM 4481 = NBRC 105725]VDY66156.1 Uncharacterised protein [Shimwellia blattae]VEC27141.1 Uncharacterised protein [Shimwellia blattae]
MIFRTIVVFLVIVSSASYAFEKCSTTTLGKLEYIWGQGVKDKQSRILLNGTEVFKIDSYQIGENVIGDGRVLDKKNNISKLIVYYKFNTKQYITTDPKYGDLYRHKAYRLFDFSGEKVVISNEFYPPADYDAPIKWVSWGQKNVVIAFGDGSRFKYEKGNVSMIDKGIEKINGGEK